ncbi:MAG: tetratricopeptide repeat protein, partial [Firmicutes bacterium]|nr:tetratricopeptide repeat protein [Bacillota bacterium]
LLGLAIFLPLQDAGDRILEKLGREPSAQTYARRGLTAYGRGSLDQAIVNLQAAIAKNPKDATARYALAQALESAGRLKEATAELLRVVEAAPELAAPHYNLAVLYQVQGRRDLQEEELKRALEIEPEFTGAHLLLGNFYFKEGRPDEALAEYNRVADSAYLRPPEEVALLTNRGEIYLAKGQRALAAADWQKALEIDPQDKALREKLRSLQGK